MKQQRVVIVEDDHFQAQGLKELIQTLEGYRDAQIELISTERSFCEQLSTYRMRPPDLFVLDVMVPWDKPSPNPVSPPLEVEEEGYSRAGIRCLHRLRKAQETADVPALLLTVLSRGDLRSLLPNLDRRTRHLEKAADDTEVLKVLRDLLGQ